MNISLVAKHSEMIIRYIFLVQTLFGTSSFNTVAGEKLIRSTDAFITFPQNGFGSFAYDDIHLILSSIVLFILFAISFL